MDRWADESGMERTRPVEVGLGLGLFVLTASMPIQILIGAQVKPGDWVAGIVAGTSAIAALAALTAAHFSFRQAQEVGKARRADHVLPVLAETRVCAWRVQEHLRSLAGDLEKPDLDVSQAEVALGRPVGLLDESSRLLDLSERLVPVGNREVWHAALHLGAAIHRSVIDGEAQLKLDAVQQRHRLAPVLSRLASVAEVMKDREQLDDAATRLLLLVRESEERLLQ